MPQCLMLLVHKHDSHAKIIQANLSNYRPSICSEAKYDGRLYEIIQIKHYFIHQTYFQRHISLSELLQYKVHCRRLFHIPCLNPSHTRGTAVNSSINRSQMTLIVVKKVCQYLLMSNFILHFTLDQMKTVWNICLAFSTNSYANYLYILILYIKVLILLCCHCCAVVNCMYTPPLFNIYLIKFKVSIKLKGIIVIEKTNRAPRWRDCEILIRALSATG